MVIDIILLIVSVYFFYLGFSRGIIRIISVVISVFLGFSFAMNFSEFTQNFLRNAIIIDEGILPTISFIITFLVGIMAIRLFATFLEGIVDAADLEVLNKFAGGLIFGSLGILVYSGILIFLERSQLLNDEILKLSRYYPWLRAYPENFSYVISTFFPILDGLWDSTIDMVDTAKDAIQPVDTTNAQ